MNKIIMLDKDISLVKKKLSESKTLDDILYCVNDLDTIYSLLLDDDDNELAKTIDKYSRYIDEINNNALDKYIVNVKTQKEVLDQLSNNYINIFGNAIFNEDIDSHCYSYKETIDLIYDFYNTINPNMYKIIKQILDEKRIIYRYIDPSYDAYTIPIRSINKYYIFVNNDGLTNIDTISYIIHELGHIMDWTINNNLSANLKMTQTLNNYIEVIPITLELIFKDYCHNNGINNDNIYNILERLIEDCIEIQIMAKIKNIKFNGTLIKNNHQITKICNDSITKNCHYLNADDEPIDIQNSIKYTLGTIIAFMFEDMYKDNPQESLKNMFDFINNIYTMDDNIIMDNFGLNKDDIIKGKTLKKVLKNDIKI